MIRHLFSLASMLSLLLCILAAAAFALRHYVDLAGTAYITLPQTSVTIIGGVDSFNDYLCISSVGKGGVGFEHDMGDCIGHGFKSPGEFWIGIWIVQNPGFEIIRWSSDSDGAESVHVTHGLLALMSTILPLIWLRARRRVLPGHCAACRYDLTGNTSGRCPECGAAVAESAGGIT
jgi:hypothetical protein